MKMLRLRDEATKAEADIAEATGAERTRLQEIIDRAERKEAKDLTDEDYQRIAEQIAQRIVQALQTVGSPMIGRLAKALQTTI